VYIDVHKAIRRMAPAPKARAHKGSIVDNSDKADLFVVDNRPNDPAEVHGLPLTKHLTNGGSRSNSPAAAFATSPKTTFIRRSSDGAAGNTIQIRGNVNDMREHLKHLGPSNLASRPKQTRYNTVKIKPGHPPNRSDSRADSSVVYHDSIVDEPYTDETAPQGGEGEGLLRSAGLDASDGVAALYQGYGSFNHPQPPTKDSEGQLEGPPKQSVLSSTASRGSNSPNYRAFLRHDSNDSEPSSDTLGSLHSSNNSPTRRRHGAARSGSITENVIEAGGVRKVVLETSQSSGDERHNNIRIDNDPPRRSPPEYSVHDGPADSHRDQAGQPPPEGEQVKKKRRRQRKKKATKTGGEDSSVVGGSG
jgi:metal transporter CNNM